MAYLFTCYERDYGGLYYGLKADDLDTSNLLNSDFVLAPVR